MPLDELHEQVASIALDAAAGHGFALGGGNALIAHGIISRPTADVDLFTNREHGVRAAAGAVQDALQRAGFQADPQDKAGDLSDIFYGMGEGLAEWTVTAADGRVMSLQMAYFERTGEPVVMEFGPVLDLPDVLGGKVAALATRSYVRDYLDTSAALQRYTPQELIGFARGVDPGLDDADFADAGQRLDQITDRQFAEAGISAEETARLRDRFASWPREAGRPDPEVSPGADPGRSPGMDPRLGRLTEPRIPGMDPGLGHPAEPGPEAWQPEPPDADLEAGQ
jgi:Nucleotidyl transferase AbiEii toxin, Type IV TA system